MEAGPLRFEVTLERRVDTQQAGGQVVFTYETIGQDLAAIEDVRGSEVVQGNQVAATMTTLIRLRYRDDIDETCRVRYSQNADDSPFSDFIYDILGPPVLDARTGRREMTLQCVRRHAEGWRSGEP